MKIAKSTAPNNTIANIELTVARDWSVNGFTNQNITLEANNEYTVTIYNNGFFGMKIINKSTGNIITTNPIVAKNTYTSSGTPKLLLGKWTVTI